MPLRWGYRWLEIVAESPDGWENSEKDKSITKARAEKVMATCLFRASNALAIEDA